MDDPNTDLETEVAALRKELARLNATRFLKMHDSVLAMVAIQFAKGLAFGLGTVIGATILVSFSVFFLSTIDFIPIIGDWASKIADEMNAGP
jgi:hypothetical protein